MTTQPLLCVRCGKRPRWSEAYVCDACRVDPAQRREAAAALALEGHDVGQRRRYVVRVYGWVGGWDRRA
jgi:hypothetical protein